MEKFPEKQENCKAAQRRCQCSIRPTPFQDQAAENDVRKHRPGGNGEVKDTHGQTQSLVVLESKGYGLGRDDDDRGASRTGNNPSQGQNGR